MDRKGRIKMFCVLLACCLLPGPALPAFAYRVCAVPESGSPPEEVPAPEEVQPPAEPVTAGAVWEQLLGLPAGGRADTGLPEGVPEETRLIAHTGLCARATQNSLLAFQLAGQAGYWAIETDVRWSSDHVLVCYHDERVDRYTEGSGLVENLPWEELSALRVAASNSEVCGPQPIATFGSYLDTCKEYGCHALIDLKYCDTGWRSLLKAIYEMVSEKDMLDLAIFQCSLDYYLEEVHELDPDAVCWFLCGEGNAENEASIERVAAELRCEGVNVPVVSEKAVALAHEYGLQCTYYVTDKREVQQECFRLGYDYVMENGWE